MNAPERLALPDIQAQMDHRDIEIDAVGVKGVRYPVTILTSRGPVPTVAQFSMTVALPAIAKGTHMSRFIELLETLKEPLSQGAFRALAGRDTRPVELAILVVVLIAGSVALFVYGLELPYRLAPWD